jgi:hypothetical protein
VRPQTPQPTALYGLRKKKVRRGNGQGIVEVDVHDTDGTAEHYADVASISEITGQIGRAQISLLPAFKNRSLFMERGYDEAAATIVESRIEDAHGVDFVQMDEGRRCPVRLKVILLHTNSFLMGSISVTALGVLRGRGVTAPRPRSYLGRCPCTRLARAHT